VGRGGERCEASSSDGEVEYGEQTTQQEIQRQIEVIMAGGRTESECPDEKGARGAEVCGLAWGGVEQMPLGI